MGQPQDQFTVQITGREIYNELLRVSQNVDRVEGKVDRVEAKLNDSVIDRESDHKDHEARIRSLERGRWPLPSIAALAAIAAIVVSVLALLHPNN